MDGDILYNDVFYTQKLFRLVMNAFAHPLTEYALESGYCCGKAFIMDVCRVFFDRSVTLYSHEDSDFAAEAAEATYAKPAKLEDADFVVLADAGGFNLWNKVNQGSLADPHKGATVIAAVPGIAGGIRIGAEGPGLVGRTVFRVSASVADCLNRAAAAEAEYPKGFEIIFVSRQGSICAAPRHIKIFREAD